MPMALGGAKRAHGTRRGQPAATLSAATPGLPWIGVGLLVAVSFGWGMSWPMFKIALAEVPLWTFRSLCVGIGGLALLVIARLSGASLHVARGMIGPLLLLSLFNVTGWNLLSVYGVYHLPSGRAAIIAFTMPLWAVIFSALFLNEAITRYKVAGLAIGFAGLVVLLGDDLLAAQTAPVGALFMLAAAVSWGIGTVLVKYHRFSQPTIVLAGWQLALGGVPIYIGALAFETGEIGPVSLWPLLALLYLIVVCFILCYWAWFKVLTWLPAGVAAYCLLLVPVVGVFSGAVVLGEPVGWQELGALALIVSGIAAVLLPEARAAPAPA